ncbi:M48 family metalloprotease [Aurantimonas marianensis]|uniref:M48 family metalloprotease n=1 Tax=Aurantimonas marianensis TaxID=2920428 RepID=A0A9X2KEP6_9HYPH|nr:M48 family metalloprotease [Aurantimonas marianensis]MCP3054490.1 M48 family metalloprotease [Aurantimonas marianensis]
MNLSPRRLSARLTSIAVALAVALAPVAAEAARSEKASLPLVRDAEIEALIGDYARPILKAAGLSRSGIEIVLVNSGSFNAFVAGRRIFVNTGAITATETPNQLIGILAHEIGHLAGGHQQRLRQQLERAKTIAIVAGLLGAGVAVAGASSGARGATQAGAGLMAGGGALARRGLFSYQRGEESTADRAALTYLRKTGQSGKGLLETFETLDRNSLFAGGRSGNYLSSHPLPRERIAALKQVARESPDFDRPDSPALAQRHDLARAKIAAYTGGASEDRRLFSRNPRGLAALYGDAIATHLSGSPATALQKIDALIEAQPNSPWFHEMRGEILMNSGRWQESAAAFSKAVKLDKSGSGLLKAQVGQALVIGGDRSQMDKAVRLIQSGLQSDPVNAVAYRFLAMAYGHLGDVGRAELATAEGYWHAGSFRQAKIFATRAQQKLKSGSPAWLQAQDIISTPIR